MSDKMREILAQQSEARYREVREYFPLIVRLCRGVIDKFWKEAAVVAHTTLAWNTPDFPCITITRFGEFHPWGRLYPIPHEPGFIWIAEHNLDHPAGCRMVEVQRSVQITDCMETLLHQAVHEVSEHIIRVYELDEDAAGAARKAD